MVLTARKRDACLRNLEKARAAPRDPERTVRSRHNGVRHGFFAKDIRGTVLRVGESLEEFDQHMGLFEAAFAPEDDVEKKIVRNLAETAWRRRRMYLAQIESEAKFPRRVIGRWPATAKQTAQETELRAIGLMGLRSRDIRLVGRSDGMLNHMERLLRALVEKRSGGAETLKLVARQHGKVGALLLEPWVPHTDGSRQLLKNQR